MALGIQREMSMRHTVSSLACQALSIFPHYLINGKIFEKKKNVIEHATCLLILSTNLSKTFHILRRSERDIIINVHRSSCKVPASSLDFNET